MKIQLYYDKFGKPLELMEWADLFENEEYRTVAKDQIADYLLSTVWHGVNTAIGKDYLNIFETMIFCDSDKDLDHFSERYSTLEEAMFGHNFLKNILMSKIETPPIAERVDKERSLFQKTD